jgi:hypothetical protein
MKIIRYRRFQLEKDPINYFREKLMLYVPWRNEDNDILNKDIPRLFERKIQLIKKNESNFIFDNTQDYEDIKRQIELRIFNEESINFAIDEENEVFDILRPDSDASDILQLKTIKPKNESFHTFKTPNELLDNEYFELISILNDRQRSYLLGNKIKFSSNIYLRFLLEVIFI